MLKEKLITEATIFVESNSEYSIWFPKEISAPIIAAFAEPVIENKLNLSKDDLKKQAEIFLREEQLEEINYCFDKFIDAIVEFTSEFISEQTIINSRTC